MSGIKPNRRWQPAFYPFKREKFSRRLLAKTELILKGPVFGCRMCGNCLLQETAFICPMECPKGLRNGPCGGITKDKKCYVDETRECVWYCIYKRAQRTGREKTLLEVLPPLDWYKAGTETWGDVVRQVKKVGTGRFLSSLFIHDKEEKTKIWDSVFKSVRQPDWWRGDSEYHPPLYDKPVSVLEKQLRTGKFVVVTEVTPPVSSNPDKLKAELILVKPYVTAVNFTDGSSVVPRMSSTACCKTAFDQDIEPVLQIAARDTTRTGLQSMVVGVNSLGIKNILCITGDNPRIGPPPVADMNMLDIDSVQMLWILRRMRDEGIYLDGRKMKYPPEFFIGAATSPFASDPELQAVKDQKKVNAGAQFFQTNLIFEPERLEQWLENLDKRDVLGKVYILIGIAPLKSYKAALYLHEKVPGVYLPENILYRMEKAGENASEEGVQIALEVIDEIKQKKGVSGIHLMTLGWEEIVGRIVTESGLSFPGLHGS
jgi:methylenetetrahydrofolate reductase (NADPH)